MAEGGSRRPTLPYYRASDVQNLMKTAKHSLHKELELIVSRAEIEKTYAESLAAWTDNARKNIKTDNHFEYGAVKSVLHDLLCEGARTSARHLRAHSLLVAADGPAKKLLHFREANYKRGEQVLPLGSRAVSRQRRRYPAVHHFLDEHKRIFGAYLDEIKQLERLANEHKALGARLNKLQYRKSTTTDPVEIKKHVVGMMDLDSKMMVVTSKYERTLASICGIARSLEADGSAFTNRLLHFELDRLKLVKTELARFVHIIHSATRETKATRGFVKMLNANLAAFSPVRVASDWHREVIMHPTLPSLLQPINESSPRSGVLVNKYNSSSDEPPSSLHTNKAFFDAIAKAESREEDTPTPDGAKLAALMDDVVGINDDVTNEGTNVTITFDDIISGVANRLKKAQEQSDEDDDDEDGYDEEEDDDQSEDVSDVEDECDLEEKTKDKDNSSDDPDRVMPFTEPSSDYDEERRHLQRTQDVAIVATKDFSTDHLNELEFHCGDEIMHMRFDQKVDMGFGYRITRFGNKHYGYYPLSHVRLADPLDLVGVLTSNEPPEGAARPQSHAR